MKQRPCTSEVEEETVWDLLISRLSANVFDLNDLLCRR